MQKQIPKDFNHEKECVKTLVTKEGKNFVTYYIDLLQDGTFCVCVDEVPIYIFDTLEEAKKYLND